MWELACTTLEAISRFLTCWVSLDRPKSDFYLLIQSSLRLCFNSLNFVRNHCKSGLHHTQMAFFLDTQETTQRFGTPTAEFRLLLDTNHVRHGSPDDLFEFAKILENNNQFRMDLSALVKSVVKNESNELLLTDMMSIIATAVGGPSVAETHTDITGPTKTLMEFLLGTGCWKHFGSPSRPAAQSAEPSLRSPIRSEGANSIRIALPASPSLSISDGIEERSSLLEIARELRQTLFRLEGNTEQVKLHLDSIEKRINRIEAVSDVAPARALSGLEPLHREAAVSRPAEVVQPVDEAIPIFVTKPSASGRAVFSHPVEVDDDEDFTAPTFAYGSEKRKSTTIPIAIFVALIVMGVTVFLLLHFGYSSMLLKAEMSRLKPAPASVSATAPAAAIPPSPSPASTSGAPETAPSSTTQPQPAASQPVTENSSAPSAISNAAATNASPDEASAFPGSKGRYIPANVMEGYLLSAPRPEYPTQARMNHIEGQVVLQATISKSGSVMALHAIKGPQSLRSAAVDAVRTWRYKPYSVNGQVRDVATTVYVNFTLKPLPPIVH